MIRVLLVDDEPLVLLSIRMMYDWEGAGISIVADCANGLEAFNYVKAHPQTDIVITDVDMPAMNGLELAEKLKEAGYTQPIIFLSSYNNFDYVRRAFRCEAKDYILKMELDNDKLLQLILELGKQRAQHSDRGELGLNESLKAQKEFFSRLACDDDTPPDYEKAGFQTVFPLYLMLMRPGDIPLLKTRYQNQLSGFYIASENLLTRFAAAVSADSVAVGFDLYCVLSDSEEKLETVFQNFYETAWSYLDIGFERRITSLLTSVFDMAGEYKKNIASFVSISRTVMRARKYIQEHYADCELSLTKIAAYAEVSKNHLSSEFSRETGETLSGYLHKIRIQQAKKLLADTGLRAYEIAERVGYLNVETFYRVFKKLTGKTPGSFL